MLMNNEEFPPESCKGLWYNLRINRFEDDKGRILHDLSSLFPTWQLDQWRRGKEYALMKDKSGELWELFYDRITPYRECQHYCHVCPSRCELYDLMRGDYTEF